MSLVNPTAAETTENEILNEPSDVPTDFVAFVVWLKTTWISCMTARLPTEPVSRAVGSYIVNAQNPFAAFLDLAEALSSCLQDPCMDTLYNCVWNRFLAWQQSFLPRGRAATKTAELWNEKFLPYLTPELLRRAAEIAVANSGSKLGMATSLFRFGSCPNDGVAEIFFREMLNFTNHKNYFGLTAVLDHVMDMLPLLSILSLDDIMLRNLTLFMICRNKSKTAKKMLAKITPPERVYAVIGYIDSLFNLVLYDRFHFIRKELCLGNGFRIDADTLEAGASDLCRHLDVPVEYYRNIAFIELRKKTGHIIRCTFEENAEMDVATFRQLIADFAKVDPRLPEHVVRILIKCSQLEEAKYLAEFYELHEIRYSSVLSSLSPSKQDEANNGTSKRRTPKKAAATPTENLPAYKLPLSEDTILFVDTIELYRTAMSHILSLATAVDGAHKLVGIDCEWPCILPPGRKQIASIIQLGLIDRIYILDVENLSLLFSDDDWQLLNEMFRSSDIKKVTFGFNSDITMLQGSYPKAFRKLELNATVDLEQVSKPIWEALLAQDCGPIPVNNSTAFIHATPTAKVPRSLVDLGDKYLGLHISKMFRKSNWSRRPLDRGQLLYAAIDAYSMLEIYREMCYVVTSQKLNVSSEILAALHGDSKISADDDTADLSSVPASANTSFADDAIMETAGSSTDVVQ